MTYLLDTQLVLWLSFRSNLLSERAREILRENRGALAFSVASLWEVSVKAALGRADFTVDPARLRTGLLGHRYTELPVKGDHAVAVRSLPRKHGDPFDRMLLAQSLVEGMTLVTTDKVLASYGDTVLKV